MDLRRQSVLTSGQPVLAPSPNGQPSSKQAIGVPILRSLVCLGRNANRGLLRSTHLRAVGLSQGVEAHVDDEDGDGVGGGPAYALCCTAAHGTGQRVAPALRVQQGEERAALHRPLRRHADVHYGALC